MFPLPEDDKEESMLPPMWVIFAMGVCLAGVIVMAAVT